MTDNPKHTPGPWVSRGENVSALRDRERLVVINELGPQATAPRVDRMVALLAAARREGFEQARELAEAGLREYDCAFGDDCPEDRVVPCARCRTIRAIRALEPTEDA